MRDEVIGRAKKAISKRVWIVAALGIVLLVVAALLTFGLLGSGDFPAWVVWVLAFFVAVYLGATLVSEVRTRRNEDGNPVDRKRGEAWAALILAVAAAIGFLGDVTGFLGPEPATEQTQQEIKQSLENSAAESRDRLSGIDSAVKDLAKNAAAGGVDLDDTDGFVDAISERNADLVDRYLKNGMTATTRSKKGSSAILYGFQGDWNNDPVALLKTFQANGFDLDEVLTDVVILKHWGEGLPMMFETELAPEGYTGGYQGGEFKGSLLLFIVARTSYVGVDDQDREVIEYLISQGADCDVPISYLEFNRKYLEAMYPFEDTWPLLESCDN